MNKPFDATMNSLIDLDPVGWGGFLAARIGVPCGDVEVVDTDLSATVQADKVFRIRGERDYMIHLEMESSSRREVPARLMRYNVLLRHQAGVPVYSLLMLLRPSASASDQTGAHRALGVRGETIHEFRYDVLKVWEQPTETFLDTGVAFAPLALLTDEANLNLPGAYGRFDRRLRLPNVEVNVARDIMGLGAVLCGLRYGQALIEELFMGGHNVLEDSVIYQSLVRRGLTQGLTEGRRVGLEEGRMEGRMEELRNTLFRLGRRKFGPAADQEDGTLKAMVDLNRLERMADRIFDATSWADLLATA